MRRANVDLLPALLCQWPIPNNCNGLHVLRPRIIGAAKLLASQDWAASHTTFGRLLLELLFHGFLHDDLALVVSGEQPSILVQVYGFLTRSVQSDDSSKRDVAVLVSFAQDHEDNLVVSHEAEYSMC